MTTQATPIRECDHALDYLYSMLEGEAKTRFEAHLTTCARCQAELEGFGRVRVVAQTALPAAEPSERLTGALHAQLMHAAAQRKPRGPVRKLGPFMRRMLSHPGYAAAAGILIIGGAVGIQLSRGHLLMPAPVAQESAATSGAPTAAPVIVASPPPEPAAAGAATPTVPADAPAEAKAELKEGAAADKAMANGKVADRKALAQEPGAAGPSGKLAKLDPRAHAAEDGLGDLSAARPITARLTKEERSRGGDRLDDLVKAKDAAGVSGITGGLVGGSASTGYTGGGKGSAQPMKPSSASSYGSSSLDPSSTQMAKPAQRAAAPARQAAAPSTTAPAPPPVVQAPAAGKKQASSNAFDGDRYEAKPTVKHRDEPEAPQPAAEAPPAANRGAYKSPAPAYASGREKRAPGDSDDSAATQTERSAANVAVAEPDKNQAPAPADEERRRDSKADTNSRADGSPRADGIDAERNRAAALAQLGRCGEASAVYESIEKKTPERLSSQDRITYERCLRALGRLEPAQRELDQLRNNRGQQQGAYPAAVLGAEQKALDVQRKRATESSTNSDLRRATKSKAKVRAADAPAQAAPAADSKNAETNVKKIFE